MWAFGRLSKKLLERASNSVFIVASLCIVILYYSWLFNRTLFYDEWMYFEELAVSPNRIGWVLSPMSEHFTPIAKFIFVLNNLIFGYKGEAYTAISLVLHLGMILSLLWLLRVVSFHRSTVVLVMLLLSTVAVYPEVVIWCHDKLVLFLIGLFSALSFCIQAEKLHAVGGSRIRVLLLVGVGCGTLLSMSSLGWGVFTLLFFAVFVLAYRPTMLLRWELVCAVGLPLIIYGLAYVVFAYAGVNSDFRARIGNHVDLRSIDEAVRTSVFTLVYGSVLPLFHIHRRPSEAMFAGSTVAILLASALFIGVLFSFAIVRRSVARDRSDSSRPTSARLAFLLLGLTLIGMSSVAQNFYRTGGTYVGLNFVLEWNRYAFLPTVGLVLVVAATWDAVQRLTPACFGRLAFIASITAIAVSFPLSIVEANAYHAGLFRNARVREIQSAFEPLFESADVRERSGGLRLPDVVIDEPLFARPLKLSSYAKFHRPSLPSSVHFLSISEFEALPPKECDAVRAIVLRSPELRLLYTNEAIVGRLAASFGRGGCCSKETRP